MTDMLREKEDNKQDKSIGKVQKAEEKAKKAEERKAKKEEKKLARSEKPKMEKKKKKKIIWGSVACVFVLFFVGNSVFAKDAGMVVNTTEVLKGDIEETVSTSGMVASEEVKVYFSQINGTIGTLNVKKGDAVESGTQLLVFDLDDAELTKKQADLQAQAKEGSYQNSVKRANENQGKLSEANINLTVLEQQITDEENYIKELQAQLDEIQTGLSAYYNQAATNISIYAIQLEADLEKAVSEKNQKEIDRLKKEIENNSIAAQNVSYELGQLANDDRVKELQDRIAEEQDKLKGYQEYKAEMETQKAASESGVLNTHQKSELEANHEMANLTAEEAGKDYSYATEGVVAEFNGIVTEMSAVEGATVVEGANLLTLANSDKVKVDIAVTKYDLEKLAVGQKATVTVSGHEYEGEIVKIDRMATTNSSGTAVVGAEVRINNPDEYIYLGIEAKVEIYTESASQILVLPVECVNADKEGDFVYTVEDGIVVKKMVVTGISSDTHIEIKEGLVEGEQVISSVSTGITEGMPVTAIPAE
ncbi:MAG: efflux RND transporter periplasmic adaptor subunit [Lachnospiraceae bacterium]|nr:efflux RND transporter periplasmic adaptor subunit [Lachnospiraceae bacterium]